MLPILHAVTPDRLLVREPARRPRCGSTIGPLTYDSTTFTITCSQCAGFMASRDARGGPPMSAARHLNRLFDEVRARRCRISRRSRQRPESRGPTLGALVGRRARSSQQAVPARETVLVGLATTSRLRAAAPNETSASCRRSSPTSRRRPDVTRTRLRGLPVPPVALSIGSGLGSHVGLGTEGTARPVERRRARTGRLAHASTERVPRRRSTSDESGDRAAPRAAVSISSTSRPTPGHAR